MMIYPSGGEGGEERKTSSTGLANSVSTVIITLFRTPEKKWEERGGDGA